MAVRFWPRGGWWLFLGFVLILPSSSIFPADDLSADRRLYLPMIAWSAGFGVLLARSRVAWQLIAVVLIALSIPRTLVWRSEQSLWQEAVERSPLKVRPRIQLARALPPGPGALAVLTQAASQFPENADIATEQARILITTGRPAEALPAFGRALALKPNDPATLNNRGIALAALGQIDAAKADFEHALQQDPCQKDAAANLSRLGFPFPSTTCR